jgi:hypothetical protein
MRFEHALGLSFSMNAAAYLVLFALGRTWKWELEARGVGYEWAPKEERSGSSPRTSSA